MFLKVVNLQKLRRNLTVLSRVVHGKLYVVKKKSWNANIVNGRFVLAVKDEGSKKEIWKVIFVV